MMNIYSGLQKQNKYSNYILPQVNYLFHAGYFYDLHSSPILHPIYLQGS